MTSRFVNVPHRAVFRALRATPALTALAVVGLVGVGSLACQGADDPTAAGGSPATVRSPELPPVPGARLDGADVLLVTVDTLRADHLSPYGSGLDTPTATRLAGDGVLFESAIAPVPLTLPSHTSLFTGLYPPGHGVRDNGGFFVDPDEVLLAERLQRAGYRTAAFVGAYVVDSYWGLGQGFDTYDDRFDFDSLERDTLSEVERTAETVVDSAVQWLEEEPEAGRPFFAWVHLYDPHDPYTPPSRFRDRAPTPYGGEVMYADEQIGRLVEALERSDRGRPAIVIYTADHGESLGQHGERTHSIFVYDATLRVPLIVTALGDGGGVLLPAGLRVPSLARLVDLAPTLLDLLGLEVPGGLDGHSLLPFVSAAATEPGREATTRAGYPGGTATRGGGAGATAATGLAGATGAVELVGPLGYAESYYPRLHYGWSELLAVQTARWKLIRAPRPELYDLREDPGETENVYERRPSIAAALEAELDALTARADGEGAAAAPQPQEMDPETIRRLRGLGYLGGDEPATSGPAADAADAAAEGPLPDPKDQLPVLQRIRTAGTLETEGRLREAREMLAELARDHPRNPDVHFALGNVHFKMGDFQDAIEAARRTLELRSDYPIAVHNLALAYRAAGRIEEAIAGFERTLQLEPGNLKALVNLAEIHYERGELEAAARYYDEAARQAPELVEVQVNRGNIALERGRLQEAERILRQALELGAGSPYLHFNLGLLAERRGDDAEAMRQYRAEVEAFPDSHKAWVNLGLLQRGRGRPADAVRSFERAAAAAPAEAAGPYLAAETLAAAGQLREALRWAEEAARRDPDNPSVRELADRLRAAVGGG